ncbi:hypothetical protein F2Q69_00035284 [Brassica cretica]|uniref:Uncharacterized protein n=1 Tax=Brassica cretica TaxID=69181 RepID=A0A8S9SIA3_BRACR|nr:hypothetical protein F2Q69_00035284 [Brassica cretica]
MAVDEQNELPEATLREAKLRRQLDGIQSQVTELNRAQIEVAENPELYSEVQSLKEKLDEHSKQLEQSAEKLSQVVSENLTLRDENQALNTANVPMVERLPGVAPPIRQSNPDAYAYTPFTDEITLIEMARKFSFPSMKAYDRYQRSGRSCRPVQTKDAHCSTPKGVARSYHVQRFRLNPDLTRLAMVSTNPPGP